MHVSLYNRSNQFVANLTDDIGSTLNFSTKIPGIFYRLSCTLNADLPILMRAYEDYLGYKIIVTHLGKIVWEGIVWSTELDLGGFSIGPRDLGFVANYVTVEYSDLLNDGRYALTTYLSDTDSQAKYGIKEAVMPYGGMTSSAADKATAIYLANHKNPYAGGRLSFPPSSDQASLRIECLGYWATTRFRKFQSLITTTTTAQTRIQEIVNRTVVPATPGTSYYLEFFSTDTSLIEGTNLTIARATLHVDTIGSYLERVVSLGDNSNGVWYIGAEHGDYSGNLPTGSPRVKVWARPTTVEFFLDMSKGIVRQGAVPVSPMMIRAGNFVKITNFSPIGIQVGSDFDQLRGFAVSQTEYDDSRGTVTLTPEGTDVGIEMILARMGG